MIKNFILFFLLSISICISAEIKYVFYFIGDGMGMNHVLLTEKYISRMRGKDGRIPLYMSTFPNTGMVSTHSKSNDITDSSAAGTCLATGKKTSNGKLGVDEKNRNLVSITDSLHKAGWQVGITTSVSIDHATPASFYAHAKSRKDYYNIGLQLASSNYEFFAGAPFLQPVPKTNNENDATKNLYDICTKEGYTFALGYQDALTKMSKKKMILLPANVNLKNKTTAQMEKLPYAIDKKKRDITLAQMVDVALRRFGEKRFFLMVEGGAIDWAAHDNDAKTVILDVIEFNNAIKAALDFYKKHKNETLIIVTADHETGGMALGVDHDYTLQLLQLQYQNGSSELLADRIKAALEAEGKKCSWEGVKGMMKSVFGLFEYVKVSKEEEQEISRKFETIKKQKYKDPELLSKDVEQLTHDAVLLLNRKARIGWTTTGHSGAFVPIYSIGNGSKVFSGVMDNTDIKPRLQQLLKTPKSRKR